MILFSKTILHENKDIESAVLVHSFVEYKAKGGPHDAFDCYAHFKEKAKQYEMRYIDLCDQQGCLIPVDENAIAKNKRIAQMFWYLLWLWFNKELGKPQRIVDYRSFSLETFNKL